MRHWSGRSFKFAGEHHAIPSGDEGPPLPLDSLPGEIFDIILNCMDAADILKLASTCRHFRRLCYSAALWRSLCAAKWLVWPRAQGPLDVAASDAGPWTERGPGWRRMYAQRQGFDVRAVHLISTVLCYRSRQEAALAELLQMGSAVIECVRAAADNDDDASVALHGRTAHLALHASLMSAQLKDLDSADPSGDCDSLGLDPLEVSWPSPSHRVLALACVGLAAHGGAAPRP